MEKAFTFKPELEHNFQVHKLPPNFYIPLAACAGILVIFVIFLIMIPFVGVKTHSSYSFKGTFCFIGFIASLISCVVNFVLYWFSYYYLFPEMAFFAISCIFAAFFGKFYFEEQRKLVNN